MGAFGDAFAAFAQPLIDQTDGSPEQLERALTLSQFCYNAGLEPPDRREEMVADVGRNLGMSDDEIDDFRRSIFEPMMARHEQMFPPMEGPLRASSSTAGPPSWLEPRSLTSEPRAAAPAKKSTVERYAPCPCGSGKKYKFCCGGKTG